TRASPRVCERKTGQGTTELSAFRAGRRTRPAPNAHEPGGVGPLQRLRVERRRADIKKCDDAVARIETERRFHLIVIRRGAGAPETAESEGVRGEQDVLRRRTGGNNLLDRGYVAVVAQVRSDDNDERCAQRFA